MSDIAVADSPSATDVSDVSDFPVRSPRLAAGRTRPPRGTSSAGAEWADTLAALEQVAANVPVPELPDLIGRLVSLEERARLRLRQGAPAATGATDADENVSAAAAARRLGVSRAWLYRHTPSLPFALKLGRRIVFSTRGLERWHRQRLGQA